MLPTLAAIRESPSIFESITTIFSRPDTLAHPEQLINALSSMAVVWAWVLLVVGILCLIQGYRFYRLVTVSLAIAIGAFAGYSIGQGVNAEYIFAGCLAAILGVGCYTNMKYAVPVIGGLVGAFIGANMWSAFERVLSSGSAGPSQHYWIGALIGLIMGGLLAFIVFKLSVVVFTSASGATLAVLGAVALLLRIESVSPAVSDSISAHAIILPMLVCVPALIGFILQENQVDTHKGEAKPA